MKLSPVLPLSSEPRSAAAAPRARNDEALRRTGLNLRNREAPGVSTTPVRAVAVAHERCNAVGTVELSCGARGLWVKFVRISSFNDGYVPYPSASGHTVNVPYDQVVRAVTDPAGLVHLTFDPSCTPFSKLVLAGLARDIRYDHHSSFLRRARLESIITLGAIAGWMPLAFGLRALLPSLSELLILAISASASLLLHAMRRDIASRWVLFGTRSEHLRSELLADLALRLGPERVRDVVPEAPAVPADRVVERDSAESAGLRSLFATAGIVAAVALVAILVSKMLLSVSWDATDARQTQEPSEAPVAAVSEGVAAPGLPAGSISPEPRKPAVVLPPCSCDRADSVLWSAGVPQLSILSTARPGKTSARRPRIYPEIAVVNNGDRELKEVMLTVDFVTGAHDGQPARRTGQEGLLYDGSLRPGQAIKWRTSGRGDEFLVTSALTAKLGESIGPASADAFHKLLTAHTPSVRLHGATMLAWLNDPRAREAIEQLEREQRAEMTPTLAMLSEATRPLRVCSVRATATEVTSSLYVEACVFNASSESRDRPAIIVRSRDSAGPTETRWIVEATLAPGSGVRTSARIEQPGKSAEAAPATLELTAEP